MEKGTQVFVDYITLLYLELRRAQTGRFDGLSEDELAGPMLVRSAADLGRVVTPGKVEFRSSHAEPT